MPVPRVPKKLKIIRGTINSTKDLKNPMEMPELVQRPDCPDELMRLNRGEDIWKDSTQDLFNLGMLHSADLQLLMAYCVEMCRYWDCQDKIQSAGSSVYPMKDKEGNVLQIVPLPYVRMSAAHLKAASSLAKEFGFTPSARSGIPMSKGSTSPVDPLKLLQDKYK